MNAAAILNDLHKRGVRFSTNGDLLQWQETKAGVMTETDLSALRDHKADAMAIIREQEADQFEERCAIIQFDAYRSRRDAERRARNERRQTDGGSLLDQVRRVLAA